MNNLLSAAALASTVGGALILFVSHRSMHKAASRVIAGYPRVLGALRAQQHDARIGLALLGCGVVLQLLAGLGYSAPLSLWRLPTFAALAGLVPYAIWRTSAARSRGTAARTHGRREVGLRAFETRRSLRLREAAMEQAPALYALEQRYLATAEGVRAAGCSASA